MLTWMFRLFGHRALHKAMSRPGKPPVLDFKLGFALFRDRRVPIMHKLVALLLGAAAVGVLVALELPVEAVIGFLLNLPGVGLDFVIDGLEAVVGPLLFGALILTRLAPLDLVSRLRAERYPLMHS